MATDDNPTDPGPTDTDLLALGCWKDVPTARILARSFDDQFGVVVLDSNGGLGARPYETLEFFARGENGEWENTGDFGPAAGGGSGWQMGAAYVYGQSPDPYVAVVHDGCQHQVPTATDGWWVFVVTQLDYDPTSWPQRDLADG
jgi:hypothetical protein